MVLFILLYFVVLRSPRYLPGNQNFQMISKKIFKKYNKSNFKQTYLEAHQNSPEAHQRICGDLKYESYQNPAGVAEVCEWIKESEEELHSNPADNYNCILDNFGGCHPLTARIADPEGGIGVKIKDKVRKMAPYEDQMAPPHHLQDVCHAQSPHV